MLNILQYVYALGLGGVLYLIIKSLETVMPHYFLKLNPCRPTFAQDMTDEEKAVMQQHVVYIKSFMDKGIVKVFGPVLHPEGVFGIGVFDVETETQLKEIIAGDPASSINQYEYYPMRAVLPDI